MAKITFTNLKLKLNTEVKTVNFENNSIEVLQYLPIDDKYSLIMLALQNAEENGIYHPVTLDMFFHLYMVYMYSNITFTEKQKENPTKLYDIIKSSGLLDTLLEAIPEEEYDMLYSYLETVMSDLIEQKLSVSGLIQSFIQDLPAQAEAAMNIVNNFDKEKFQNVINFAKAANGGRDI